MENGDMDDPVEDLQKQLAEARAEYARVGAPLLDRVVRLGEQIMDAKRERGELFYVDYYRYGGKYTEECGDRAEAEAYAESLEDSGVGSVIGIRGPEMVIRADN